MKWWKWKFTIKTYFIFDVNNIRRQLNYKLIIVEIWLVTAYIFPYIFTSTFKESEKKWLYASFKHMEVFLKHTKNF